MSKVDTIVALKAQNKMLVELVKNINNTLTETKAESITAAHDIAKSIVDGRMKELDAIVKDAQSILKILINTSQQFKDEVSKRG